MKSKKILAVTIAAAMVNSIFAVPVTSTAAVTADKSSTVSTKSNSNIYGYYEYEYNVIGGSVVLTKYMGVSKAVTLPSRINGMNVASIGEGCFEGSDVRTVVIPDTVTCIESRAFKNCGWLTSVTFSKNITKICNEAFEGCDLLKKAILPGKLKYVGTNAFYGCSALNEVFIPKTIEETHAPFVDCPNLKRIVFENGIKKIPSTIFCGSLIKEIVIPSSVEKIEFGAFISCPCLKKITIPDSVTTIEDDIVNPKPGTYPIIIYCNNNTEAHRYARRSALPCVVMDVNPNVVNHPRLGDVDGDGEITANDALIILRASVEEYPSNNLRRCGDINGDGILDSADAHAVLRMSVQ